MFQAVRSSDHKKRWNGEWKKTAETVRIEVPEINSVVKNTLIYIVNKFPEMAERYGDFLSGFNLDLDSQNTTDFNLDLKQSEKYIVSLKIQKYIQNLEKQKQELVIKSLHGEIDARQEIQRIDEELKRMHDKQDKLV